MKKIIIVTLIIGLIFAGYILYVNKYYPELETQSQFGGMLGGINALFSGLALLGLVYTVSIQREELRLQREELMLTRQELKRTAEAQEKSEQALSKQAESLKQTAKLNGLSSLLQRYTSLRDVGIARYGSGGVDREMDRKADKIREKIEEIIELKS